MKVTNVWFKKYESGKLLGFADVQFSLDNSDRGHMIWKGLKIFRNKDGEIEVGLPSKKDENNRTDERTGKPIYHPVVVINVSEERPNPIGQQFLDHLREEVEKAYLKDLTEDSEPPKKNTKSTKSKKDSVNSDDRENDGVSGKNYVDVTDIPF